MPSRISVKDIVLLLAVLAVGALVVISMRQDDRRFVQQQQLIERLDAIERSPDNAGATGTDTKASGDHADWARPGVAVIELGAPRHSSSLRCAIGGQLVEALESSPQTLTPIFATDAQARRVIQDTVCQTLATTDALLMRPSYGELANAYQLDPEGMWLRVRLNDNARFSDGRAVTAEDVRFSLDMLRTPALDNERARAVLDGIESIDVISPRVAEFRFKEPRPLNAMHAMCSLYILPKHYYDRFTPDQLNQSTGLLMGSGPFKLRSVDPEHQWKPGQDIVLVRDPQAWSATPALDSIRFTVITDSAARLTALKNGDVDIIRPTAEQLEPFMAAQYQRLEWAQMILGNQVGSSYSAIAWNCGDREGRPSIVSDRTIRTALTLLTDRDRIVDEYYHGAAAPATSPFPVRSWMSDHALKPHPFDPAQAATILDEAGWTTRNAEGVRTNAHGQTLEIDLAVPRGSKMAEFVALMLKDEAAKAGIRITIAPADMAAIAEMHRTGDFDGAIVGWSHGLPENEPRQNWHSASIASGDNFCRFATDDADHLIELGERTLAEGARMELWHRLHRVLYDEHPCTFLVNPYWSRLVSPRICTSDTTFYGFDYPSFSLVPTAPEQAR